MKTKVKCLECGKEFGVITSQHLKTCCGLTLNQYKEKHPDAETVSEKIKFVRQNNFKKINKQMKTVFCSKCGKNPIEFSVAMHWDYVCDKCKAPKIYPGKIYLPEEDLVVCQICWQGMEQISYKHTEYIHNMSLQEYQKKYPKSILTNKRIREIRKTNHIGNKNPAKRKDVRKKMSESQRFSSLDYINKYPWIFPDVEQIRDELGVVEVRCKKCGKWFHPNPIQMQERIRHLSYGNDGSYFYCSEECKGECPLYRLNPLQYLQDPSVKNYTGSEYQIFREEVLRRQREQYGYNFCEKCESTEKLHVHHEKPQKTHPIMSLDPDNGIVLCEHCHLTQAHKDSCSLASLANKICK